MNPLTYLLIYMQLFKEPIIGPLKSKMAEIAILKIHMTSFFLLRVVRFGKNFADKVQNDM